MSRVATATRLAFDEQRRRPLLIALLVGLPFFFITRAIAQTEEIPRAIGLPGGSTVVATMREIHGADMAAITVAFLAGLVGMFTMQSARQADRRLVIAGFRPLEAVAPRLLVVLAATAIVVAVSLAVTALNFTPRLWAPFVVGNLLVGLIYALLGALAGAAVGKISATYLVLFGAMLDLGIVQNPMFGSGEPAGWATALPGHGPGRVIVDAAFSTEFHAWEALGLGIAWLVALVAGVIFVLGRLVGLQRPGQ